MRLQFDSNICNSFVGWPDANDRATLTGLFRSHAFSLYITKEFIIEILPMARWRREILGPCAGWLLEIMNSGRLLKDYELLVQQELKGQGVDVFARPWIIEATKKTLADVASGREPKGLDEFMRELEAKKRDQFEFFRDLQGTWRRHLSVRDKAAARRMAFPEFDEAYGSGLYQGTVEGLCSRVSVGNPTGRAREILANRRRFPYTDLYLKIFSFLFHFYYVHDRRVEEGDYFDASQLVYLAGLDGLVTEERRLRELWTGVEPERAESVMTFRELIGLSRT